MRLWIAFVIVLHAGTSAMASFTCGGSTISQTIRSGCASGWHIARIFASAINRATDLESGTAQDETSGRAAPQKKKREGSEKTLPREIRRSFPLQGARD
ncbi:hypothetical protein [Bradyrhizobium sp. HKCCYLS20291]|uniref:hypothetical protein n=1 Tax=Bradyrhizobium sp. HKCCYLS20291 TaxID=3420766 RepID=UPI003EC0A026